MEGMNLNDYVSKSEHNEFVKRIDSENDRQNKRLETLENSVKEISELTISVKELATNMKHMVSEQEKQGAKLEAIESRDGDHWRSIVSYAITAIVGAVLAIVFSKIGLVP